ncbi:hypothetical protein BY996DRAFT_6428210 [Phakopsora pachyrhizi]|nr:hypothetical protein BY996DRAFT_6428210 [Phakopsora pachyrhizi]
MWDQADWNSSEELTLSSPSFCSDSDVYLGPKLFGCVPPHLLDAKQTSKSTSDFRETKDRIVSSSNPASKRRTLMYIPRRSEAETGQTSAFKTRKLTAIRAHITGNPLQELEPVPREFQSAWGPAKITEVPNAEIGIKYYSKTQEHSNKMIKSKRLSIAQFFRQKFNLNSPKGNSLPVSNTSSPESEKSFSYRVGKAIPSMSASPNELSKNQKSTLGSEASSGTAPHKIGGRTFVLRGDSTEILR